MIYDVRHTTSITYDGLVRTADFNIRMRPVEWADQRLISHRLDISPEAQTRERPASYPAPLTRARIETKLTELKLDQRFRMEVVRTAPVPKASDPTVAQVRAAGLDHQGLDALSPANYMYPSLRVPVDAEIAAWCASDLNAERGIVEAGLALSQRIQTSFRYDPKASETDTPIAETFAGKHGVCQDFAHIMLCGLRGAGLPAAYVSGYLRTRPPEGKPRLVGADATHAWLMIWCGEDLGWLGFDPTNGCTVGEDHIVAGVGRDYSDVSPVDGILLGLTQQTLKVGVDVLPVEENA